MLLTLHNAKVFLEMDTCEILEDNYEKSTKSMTSKLRHERQLSKNYSWKELMHKDLR